MIVAAAKRIIALAGDIRANDLRHNLIAEAAAIITLVGGGGAEARGRRIRLSIDDRDRPSAAGDVGRRVP